MTENYTRRAVDPPPEFILKFAYKDGKFYHPEHAPPDVEVREEPWPGDITDSEPICDTCHRRMLLTRVRAKPGARRVGKAAASATGSKASPKRSG
jgi:hypothetical protein